MPRDREGSETTVSRPEMNGNNSLTQFPADPPDEVRERERMKLQVLSRKATERTRMLKHSSHKLLEASRRLLSESVSKYEKSRQRRVKLLNRVRPNQSPTDR